MTLLFNCGLFLLLCVMFLVFDLSLVSTSKGNDGVILMRMLVVTICFIEMFDVGLS